MEKQVARLNQNFNAEYHVYDGASQDNKKHVASPVVLQLQPRDVEKPMTPPSFRKNLVVEHVKGYENQIQYDRKSYDEIPRSKTAKSGQGKRTKVGTRAQNNNSYINSSNLPGVGDMSSIDMNQSGKISTRQKTMKKPKYTRSFNQKSDNGMPVPFTGMRNHNLSNKELRTFDQPKTHYERTNKWVKQASAAGYDANERAAKDHHGPKKRKVRAPSTHISSGNKNMVHHQGQHVGINGILQQMN